MKQFSEEVRIDVKQIPEDVKRMIGAAILKAYREHAGRKEGERKEKAPA